MEVRRELTVESNVNMDEETKKMYDLAHYAGINFDPNLFKHIVDLLKELKSKVYGRSVEYTLGHRPFVHFRCPSRCYSESTE